MDTPAKVALATIAALTIAILGLFGCVPGPAYFITKASCAGATFSFGRQTLDGVDGFTDYSGSISEKTAIKMLAEHRVKFIEQKVLSSYSKAPLGLLVPLAEKDSFAKVWIDKVGASSCLRNNDHMHFGVTYDLYTQGMKPSECLAGTVVTQPTGRYFLETHYKELLGSSSVEYDVLDRLSGSKVDSIQSARVRTSIGREKLPLPRTFIIGCTANQQTVANLFQGGTGHESAVPPAQEINTTRPRAGTLHFIHAQMSKDEFLKAKSNTDKDIILASKGLTTVSFADGHFIGHYKFPYQTIGIRPLPVPDGVLVPTPQIVTIVWRTGEVQNLGVSVDEGKFLSTDGYKVVGNKLLVFAVTDWTKGWAVFEASLSDFDISVARRVMAEVAMINESIKTRFIVEDGGLVRDKQTGTVWAQADSGRKTYIADALSFCNKKGSDWSLPWADQLVGLFLSIGTVRTNCGSRLASFPIELSLALEPQC